MSKSTEKESENGVINIMDTDKQIEKKIKSAVTDSFNIIKYDEKNQPGLANLINIYSGLTEENTKQIIKKYENKMYGHLKVDLVKIVQREIGKIRDKTNEILENKKYLDKILTDGAKTAQKIAKENYNIIANKFLGKN
jgi:tryptophanyl-tRNA synthetase